MNAPTINVTLTAPNPEVQSARRFANGLAARPGMTNDDVGVVRETALGRLIGRFMRFLHCSSDGAENSFYAR
jgi:hypothetical protein